ncbi:DUF6998 domain-containing protein [Zhongshania aliphaticivorans]|uniref:DUF6998 domain-containing protein n=1 Tax=Zhongshania aliphaticivorans TaxID=1470434 RepID=UPI0012E554A5|nr:hypothetical protein [Zhongshania aliphaticivorans]CAA0097079.1 Uncharacterised protein [Zhongshania aliphaticivorans]
MALTQMQIIQSLGDAMAWFERELQWGVPPTELRHLIGRIGELYSALITNGQMATSVNQRGYDVVSADGERVSVKTTAVMGGGGHISFNPSTLDEVDRVIILRVNTEEMQIETLLDASVSDARERMGVKNTQGKCTISLAALVRPPKSTSELKAVRVAVYGVREIRELESGTIEVYLNGELQPSSKPELRKIAAELNINILNGSGNPYNTRQLGSVIISAIENAY